MRTSGSSGTPLAFHRTQLDCRMNADALLGRVIALAPSILGIWPSLLAETLRLTARQGIRPEGLDEVLTYVE